MALQPSSAAVVIEYLDTVWNAGNVDAVAQYVSDEGYTIRRDPGDAWEGRTLTVSELAERVRSYLEQVPGIFTVQEILDDGHKVMVTWLWSPTVDGDLRGDAAAAGATVYYLEGGKLCGHWQVTTSIGSGRTH